MYMYVPHESLSDILKVKITLETHHLAVFLVVYGYMYMYVHVLYAGHTSRIKNVAMCIVQHVHVHICTYMHMYMYVHKISHSQ